MRCLVLVYISLRVGCFYITVTLFNTRFIQIHLLLKITSLTNNLSIALLLHTSSTHSPTLPSPYILHSPPSTHPSQPRTCPTSSPTLQVSYVSTLLHPKTKNILQPLTWKIPNHTLHAQIPNLASRRRLFPSPSTINRTMP